MPKLKELIVYLDTGISVMIPQEMDADSEEAADIIRGAFRDKVLSQDDLEYDIDSEEDIEEEA